MTAAEQLAACLARGGDPLLCQDAVDAQSVDGAYCDGRVVVEATGRRCIDQATLDRVEAARKASPLPHPDEDGPLSPPRAMPSVSLTPTGWALLGLAAIVAWRMFGR